MPLVVEQIKGSIETSSMLERIYMFKRTDIIDFFLLAFTNYHFCGLGSDSILLTTDIIDFIFNRIFVLYSICYSTTFL
jgi:hypothetical protein